LRIYHISGQTEREATRDDVLPLRFPVRTPDGSYINSIPVKKGQTILIPGAAVDRLKCVWGPDADEWRPDRWLDPEVLPPMSSMNSGWGHTFAFSEGPRNCIGFRLGEWALYSPTPAHHLLILALYEWKVRHSPDYYPSATYNRQFFVFTIMRRFRLHDTGANITRKVNAAMLIPQPLVVGEESKGALLPVQITLLEDSML